MYNILCINGYSVSCTDDMGLVAVIMIPKLIQCFFLLIFNYHIYYIAMHCTFIGYDRKRHSYNCFIPLPTSKIFRLYIYYCWFGCVGVQKGSHLNIYLLYFFVLKVCQSFRDNQFIIFFLHRSSIHHFGNNTILLRWSLHKE